MSIQQMPIEIQTIDIPILFTVHQDEQSTLTNMNSSEVKETSYEILAETTI